VLLIPKRHRRTDRQTDGRLTLALPRSALASRGKKTDNKIPVEATWGHRPHNCWPWGWPRPMDLVPLTTSIAYIIPEKAVKCRPTGIRSSSPLTDCLVYSWPSSIN